MAKKHKGDKHEKVRKAAPAAAPRPAAKAPKHASPASLRSNAQPAVEHLQKAEVRRTPSRERSEVRHYHPDEHVEPELIVLIEPEPEPEPRYVFVVEEDVTEESIELLVDPDPPAPRPLYVYPASDWEQDLVFTMAEEQVALAMLEAEQAAALCQGFGEFDAFPSLDVFAESGSVVRVDAMNLDVEDEPFAFDHI